MKPKPAPQSGNPLLQLLAAAFVLGGIGFGMPTVLESIMARAQQTGPVSVQLISPANGSVISNTIELSAEASSIAGPITMVEFYCDGKIIGVTGSNGLALPQPPDGFNVVTP